MANHKSAAKRARQDEKRRARRLSKKKSVRSVEKKLMKAIQDGDKSKAPEILRDFTSKMDKAVQKGIFHAKTASRKVSRLAKQVSKTFN